MLTLACPNCGAEVVFRSPALPSRICDYCQTIVMRSGTDLEMIGKAAILPFDVSPVRIGMTGRFDDQPFEAIGRVRWRWTDGSWNEWLLLLADGSHAWLGEAMGQYMLLRERPLPGAKAVQIIASGGQVPVGTEAVIAGESLIVSDAREVTCIAAEGELPFAALPSWTIYSVDFRSPSGNCASLQRDGGEASFYHGRYVTLEELRPRGLRAFEGWPMPAYAG